MDQNPPTERGLSGESHDARSAEPGEPAGPPEFVWPPGTEWSAEPAEQTETAGSAELPAFPEPPGPAGPGHARSWTFPHPPARPAGPLPAATYWRRRVVALALGVSLLAVLVWAVNGTLSVPATGSAASAARRGEGAGTPAGTGSGAARAQAAGAAAAGQGPRGAGGGAGRWRARASRLAGPGRAGGAGSAAASPGRGGARARAVPACTRQDVVLSLLTRRRWYRPARRPEFLAEAVSTGRQPCRFNVGTRFLSVVVTAGRTTVWSSAACVHQARSRSVVLTRGVPAVIWASWDRKSTAHGCRPARHRVRPGTYTAAAVAPHNRSRPIVFVLIGPGVAEP